MKKRKPSLHITILMLFISFLFLTAGSLTWYNYKENSAAAIAIANDLLTKVSGQVAERIENLFQTSIHVADQVSELPDLADQPDFMSHPSQWFLAQTLSAQPQLYSMYIGYGDGQFYQIISLQKAGPALYKQLGAPLDASLVIRRIFPRPGDERRVELWLYLDAERRIVGSRTMRSSEYDPRLRPWYRMAINQEGIIRTPFYVFKSTGSMGITFARRFDGNIPGVFGVDLTLAGLSDYFASQRVGKSGYVVMFDQDFKIMAHPDPDKVLAAATQSADDDSPRASDPLMDALSHELKNWEKTSKRLTLNINGTPYLVHVDPMKGEDLDGLYLAVAAPLSEFTGYMDQTRTRSMYFAAVILLLAIPIAAYYARLISRPLHTLAQEAEDIRRFKLESPPVDVHSVIAEIDDLAKAVRAMKRSLSSFGRYVPKTLVKRLLIAKETPELGGQRREATMLFTDIADFTTISESTEAEELMIRVSEYLQTVGSVILEHGGTIDKYIGDAIMAFWNAPNKQENHAELACETALLARNASQDLNERWRQQGLPAMYTRFGLHTGDPIIGNVGSDDRLNYTAMGAPVNLASRLEGLNKYYGTQILVSEPVKEQAGSNFLFRPVGKVMPKGTSTPIAIFELMGRAGECTGFLEAPDSISCFNEIWETGYASYQARRFEDAAEIFEKCVQANPHDQLAATMLERAKKLAQSPPDENWDGVDVFTTK